MTDFQIALVAIGGLVLVGVLVLNRIQERRALRERMPLAQGDDASTARGVSGGATIDREFDHEFHVPDEPIHFRGGDPAPRTGAPRAEPVASPESGVASAVKAAAVLDPRVDYIAEIAFSDPHDGEEVLRVAEDELRATRRVAWEGWSVRSGGWEHLSPSRQYERVRVGLQLLDRRGAMREDELRTFCESVQSLGTSLVGEIDFAPRGESLKGAAEIDRAIADLDIQVGLNVIRRSGQPFAASLIAQVVTLSEGRLGTDGRFHVPGPGGSERLWVANLEATPFREADLATQASRGVTIAMDVARAPDEAGGFADFVAFARDLARVLEGELVDDDHRPVNEDSLGAIQAEVDRVRARLVTLGLPAGSALAMRLFA